MHHTDYSANLRAAHHRTLKNSPNRANSSDYGQTASKDLLYAVIAALLVLLCLFQMDPANAGSHNDTVAHMALETQPTSIDGLNLLNIAEQAAAHDRKSIV